MFGKRKNPNLLALYAEELKEEAIDVLSWRRRLRRKRLILFLNLLVWSLAGFLLLIIINVLIFLPGLKNVYWQALSGKNNLEKALPISGTWPADRAAWQTLRDNSQAAQENFNQASKDLKKLKFSPLGWLPFTRQKLNDGLNLLRAGSLISESLALGAATADNFFALLPNQSALDFSRLNQEQKLNLIKLVAASQPPLEQARNNLSQARQALNNIHHRDLLANHSIDLVAWEKSLAANEQKLAKAAALAQVLPILSGYPEPADYLLLMQNNDELRPTGGFIGVYATAKTANGELSDLITSDVYHLDMPVQGKMTVQPPAPLKKYLGVTAWYLRDANWSPDWPTSAKQIADFYAQENRLQNKAAADTEFDFIIGLTPRAVVDLLEITGPIAARGQVYSKDNFTNLLQETTGLDYARAGLSDWNRKAVIADITKEMQKRILGRLDKTWQRLLEIVSANLDRKNILVYSTNPLIYDSAKANNWLGDVRQTEGDYLFVVDSNLAALKTDAVVNKSLNYTVRQTGDGLVANLQINYANRGSFNWKTTRYRTFTRVYVPQGSQLIKAAGHEGGTADVVVGEELSKTYFGAFIEIEPGKIGGLSFEYKLPYNLYAQYESGAYSLLVQKQPGSRLNEVSVDCQFAQPISHYEPAILFSYVNGGRFLYKGDFLTDKIFTIKF